MWYSTKEEAEKACKEKEKEFKTKFYVLKDTEQENCYWAQRVESKRSDLPSPTPLRFSKAERFDG
jgi:hypothetical protein